MENHVRAYINEMMDLTVTEIIPMMRHKEKEFAIIQKKLNVIHAAETSESTISLAKTLTKELLAIEIEHQVLDYVKTVKDMEEE